jgi:hypothetical protein
MTQNADLGGRYGWTRWRYRWACDLAIAVRRWRCRRFRPPPNGSSGAS